MLTRSPRVQRMALVLALLFCSLSGRVKTTPAPAQHTPSANPEEIQLLEELTDWVVDTPEPGTTQVQDALGNAVRERASSFEVFRSYHDVELQHARVERVPYGSAIRQAAERHALDPLLLAAVVEAESSFNPEAVSSKGAIGLMQVMPNTAGSSGEEAMQLLSHPQRNLDLGAAYLAQLLKRFDGDLALSLAAYNAGPGNVRRFGGIPPFRETTRYVDKVLEIYVNHHRELWRSTEAGELLALL